MWGQYYLCGSCGFTAEDDDDLHVQRPTTPEPPIAHLAQMEAFRLRQTTLNRH
jgi:hypothetical protein